MVKSLEQKGYGDVHFYQPWKGDTVSRSSFPACQLCSKLVNDLLGQHSCPFALCHYALLMFLQQPFIRFMISVSSSKVCMEPNQDLLPGSPLVLYSLRNGVSSFFLLCINLIPRKRTFFDAVLCGDSKCLILSCCDVFFLSWNCNSDISIHRT